MINIVTELPEGGTSYFKGLFSQSLAVRPGLRFWELGKQYENETVTLHTAGAPEI